jgi:hypothetical protein
MQSILTRSLSAALLATAPLAVTAQTLLTHFPIRSDADPLSFVEVNSGIAINSATNRIYIPINYWNGTYTDFRLLVINGATDKVVRNLASFPANSYYIAIAIDPTLNVTYVEAGDSPNANSSNQCTVSVVDGQTEEIVKTIVLPPNDCGPMAVDPVTGKVYIRAATKLDVVESEATGVIGTYSLPATTGEASGPGSAIAVSPYVHRLYFTASNLSQTSESLGFFDTLENQISETKAIPFLVDYGGSFVVNRETGNLFGANAIFNYPNYFDNYVTVFNSAGSLLATITLPTVPLSGHTNTTVEVGGPLDVDPKTNRAFVAAYPWYVRGGLMAASLYVIDGASNTVSSNAVVIPQVMSVTGGSYISGVAVNPDTGKVYVVYYDNANNNTLTVYVYSEQ